MCLKCVAGFLELHFAFHPHARLPIASEQKRDVLLKKGPRQRGGLGDEALGEVADLR